MKPVLTMLFACTLVTALATAEEGMWTFDNPPTKQLAEKYGFTPTQEWLDHLRLSSVRFNDGGSGSFVSPTGLVLTNHHVALGQLQKVSSPQKDYVADGFLARTPEEELRCPDLELNVLVSMENVTERVLAAVKPGMSEKEANDARKAAIAAIEKASMEQTGLRSDVVTLYHGGEYWLYRYKKYTDVRLVFAPEQQIAFFGGDPDNFTYPRYDLDMALFRVYEDGKPVKPQHYLKWNPKGAQEGELVFVSGHPGSTNRLFTLAQLETLRDVTYPLRLAGIERRLAVARAYAARGKEQARQAAGMIFGLENSKKALSGEYKGLKDPQLMNLKAQQEQELRSRVAANTAWQKAYGDAWAAIEKAQQIFRARAKEYTYRRLSGFRLPGMALNIVQLVAEVQKPDGERLDGFHDSQLPSLKFRLFSPAPVYPEFEEVLLADGLREALEQLGPNDPFVKAALAGKSPEEVAKEAIAGTRLADPEFRKKLVEGGVDAVSASTDPLIALARRVDPLLRQERKWYEDQVESVVRAAGEKIGKARFAIYGKTMYPDATFTLRLAYGTVTGYPYNGTVAPPKTTFFGLYDRAASFDYKPPFHLPQRFLDRRQTLDLATPLNFVCTCDIIGGNSGSPVVNRNGELVGLIFDGNIESLVGRFVFDLTANRAVAVHSAGMTEALRKLYDAEFLLQELLAQR
ncbi:MAG: S46 family peptidase [Thermoanaerobaculum sp.]|nr:S46 family peptidase [Thermoanaerobaculum sp.]MDW7967572.1 S46 family peptidase [Thermoanaerobaculum sp.]